MTAKLAQLVNSAFFGIQQHVADPWCAASGAMTSGARNVARQPQVASRRPL